MADQPVGDKGFHARQVGPFACLTFLVLAFYGRLLCGHSLYASEILSHWFGQKFFIRSQLLNGNLPVLDPHVLCGSPLLENFEAAALYPLNVLLLMGDAFWGLHVFVVCHYVLAAWMMYAFVRWGGGGCAWSSALAGLAYACGGYLWSMADHMFFLSAPWVPLYFLGLVRVASETQRRRKAAASACVVGAAMLLYCGNLQQACDAFLLGGVLVLVVGVRLARKRAWFGVQHFAVFYIATLVTAVLLAGPQLVPALLGGLRSPRIEGVSFSEAGAWSFVPVRLVEYLVPLVFGPRQGYGCALRAFYGGAFPWSESVFCGIPVLIGITCVPRRRWRSALGTWLGVMVGLGLLLAVGRHLPVYALFRRIVPGFGSFQHPEVYLYWVHFGGVALGGLGVGAIRRDRVRVRTACAAAWTLMGGALILGVVLAFGYLPWQDLYAHSLLKGGSIWEASRFLRWQLLQCAGSALAATACIGALRWQLKRPGEARFARLALLITALHLQVLGLCVHWTIPRGLIDDTRTVADLLPDTDPRQFRIYSDASIDAPVSTTDRQLDPLVSRCLGQYARLVHGVPALFGLRTLSGSSACVDSSYVSATSFGRHPPALVTAFFAGRYVVVRPAAGGTLPPEHRLISARDGDGYVLLENLKAFPRVHATNQHVLADDAFAQEAALAALTLRTAETEMKAAPVEPGENSTSAGVELYFRPQADPPAIVISRLPSHYKNDIAIPPPTQAVQIVDDAPGRLTVQCAGPVWVVVRDWFCPGWQASVDGIGPVEITRADGGVMAVYVPVGRHTVSLSYRPPGFIFGLCLLALGVSVGAAFLCLRRVGSLDGERAADRGSDAR